MSDEIVNEAPVAEAPAPEASAPVEQQSQGFSTPYEAFRHLPEYSGQDDLAIAQDLYRSKQGYLESQRVLSQYQNLIPQANEYLRNKAEYEKWQAAQREAAQPKPAEKPKWWADRKSVV